MEGNLGWTCPGEDAGHCTEVERGSFEGPCDQCPVRREMIFAEKIRGVV